MQAKRPGGILTRVRGVKCLISPVVLMGMLAPARVEAGSMRPEERLPRAQAAGRIMRDPPIGQGVR